MSSDELLFSRQEALAGFPAKRASTLLYLIENRTAHLTARSHLDFSLSNSAGNPNLAFIEEFATVQASSSPTIQQLEHYAPQWADLIPANPTAKAALAHVLSQKYDFTGDRIPQIVAVLDLKQELVRSAYKSQYQTPLVSIFVQLSVREKLRWMAARIAWRIEDLPPFWLATLVTVALGLPQAFLALPIAAAGMGALSSLALVVAIGMVNILTMTCMAEAIARSGDFHYGTASIKQLAVNYLGEAGSFILAMAVGIRVFLIALACYVGLSATMANFTPISPSIWAAVLFAIGIYLLSRQSVKFTVAIMILLAGVNIVLLSGLSLLAFTQLEISNLFYLNLPFASETFQPQLIQQVFGVSLMLYFGHVYVGECAKLVLPKDRSGSSLIQGSIAGTIILTLLFCIWILAVNGAIAPSLLAMQSGTVLEPLAQQIGLIVTVLGSVLIIFLLGMAWIRSSSLLFNITKEWIPHPSRTMVRLFCDRGRIILQPKHQRHYPRLGISYLGLKQDVAQFRLDLQTEQTFKTIDFSVDQKWRLNQLQVPELANLDLELELRSINQKSVALKVNSQMLLKYEGMLSNADINGIELPSKNTDDKNKQQPKLLLIKILAERRFLVAMMPLTLVFFLTEWLFIAQAQSFTSVLAFAGVLGNSLVGGIFPVLLLISSRRKGELVPKTIWQKLEQPWLLAGIYSLFITILLIHGLLIWQDAIARFSALAVAVLALGATAIAITAGAFTPRTVIELHEDRPGKARFNITAAGKPQIGHISLGYGNEQQQYQGSSIKVDLAKLDYAICQLSSNQKSELKIWSHRCRIDGSNNLPTQLEVYRGDKKMQFDLKLSGGKILLPEIASGCWLKFKFT